MKMSDITNEGAGIDTLKSVGKATWGGLKKGFDYVTKPKQYSNPLAQTGDTLSKDIATKTNAIAQLPPKDPSVKAIKATRKDVQTNLDDLVKNSDGSLKVDNGQLMQRGKYDSKTGQYAWSPVAPDKFTAGQRTAQAATGAATANAVFSDDPYATARDVAATARDVVGGGVKSALGAVTGLGAGREEPEEVNKYEPAPTNESIADILKLSGQKQITERDNIAGIIKPKEIVALHESQQLGECGGMMPNGVNQTASLSINATAGSGEEVANMLAAIMNLAGVKPVTGDMLGGANAPMPIVKAIDIVSRDTPDSMNDGEEQLSGMEEEYANTPEDPTEVPDFDSNKMAYEPNAVDVGDRMDGTMPKGIPGVTKESLAQAFEAFKNGQ